MFKNNKEKHIIFFLLLLTLLVMFLSINMGYSKIPFKEIIISIIDSQNSSYSFIIFKIRFPRIVLALLSGMGLGLSGCILQTITENSLADPGVLGINSGAGFMLMLFFKLFPKLHGKSLIYQPLFAMLGGLLVMFILLVFSKRNGEIRGSYLLLGGISLSAAFTALMTIMASNMDNSSYQLIVRWMVGNIWGSSWFQVKALLPYLLIIVPLIIAKANTLDILTLGRESSIALGSKVEKEKKELLILAVALAASCVSVSGGISFVGLVSPHISRKYFGGRHKILIPTSMFIGGILLVIADGVGRNFFQPIEIPVGIVISILASPYFLYLLKSKRQGDGL